MKPLYRIVGITRKVEGTNLYLESDSESLVLENIVDNAYNVSDLVGVLSNKFYWLPSRLDIPGINKFTLIGSSGIRLEEVADVYVGV